MRVRKLNKMLLLLLVTVLVISLAACSSGKKDNGASEASQSTPTASQAQSEGSAETPTPEKAKFSYMVWAPTAAGFKASENFAALQEAANVEIEIIDGGDRDNGYWQNVDLRAASNDLPDTIVIKQTQAEMYGSQGAFVDWTPLIEEHAPNIKKYLDENPDYKKFISSNGKIYSLSMEQPRLPWVNWMYRQDWFDKLNLKAPTTIDELTEVLRALKKANPGGQKNFYPLNSDMGLTFLALKYNFDAGAKLPGPDGKLTGIYSEYAGGLDVFSPGYKNMVEWFRLLYSEGLYDPEAAIMAQGEEPWVAKMLNGNAAVTFHGLWRVNDFTVKGKELNPEYQMAAMPPLAENNPESAYPAIPQYMQDWSVAISSQAKNPVDIVKFYDFLFSEEGMNYTTWGIKGKTYDVVDGKKQYLIKYEDATKEGSGMYYAYVQGAFDFAIPADHEAAAAFQPEAMVQLVTEYQTYVKPVILLKPTADDLAKMSVINAKLNPKLNEWLVKFVTGKAPMTEWENFLAEMESLGYHEITEMYQKAYDATYK